MNRLAVKIKEARIKAKMSEKDLAKACGQNINYILQIESGKKVINEQIAENILKILGEQIDFFQDSVKEEIPAAVVKAPVKQVAKPTIQEQSVTPNDQWTDALSGVIKKFPIVDEVTGKPVDSKELSILGKKVEGIHFEKVLFVRISDSDLPKLRIMKGDTVTLHSTTEIQNQGIYYMEYNQKKLIRQVSKHQNNKAVFSKGPNEPETEVNLKDLKILGKIVKVEFYL